MVGKRLIFAFAAVFFLFLISLNSVFVTANIYVSDIYFTVPNTVYVTNERIEFKGYVYQANYSNNGTLVTNSTALANVNVNLTIKNSTGNSVNNYTFTTDSSGAFYSKSNYYTNSTQINASSIAGTYYIRAEYRNPNSNISFSEIQIIVVNQTLDLLRISSHKAVYNPSESVIVSAEAIKLIGDKTLYIANVSINGSLRNSSKSVLQSFNCITGSNGKCSVSVTAPSTYGSYILELDSFKTFNSFLVVPFSYAVSMKDEFGESYKNVFALGEQASVEVKVNNASNSDVYTFSGYVADSDGNSVKTITSTTLNSNNSFTNNFLFTVDAVTFSYKTYSAHVTVVKTGDGSISSLTSFQVQDWMLGVDKKGVGSGFEYEYSVFSNKTIRFEALPNYRSNGSMIVNISSSSFIINLKDNLNNIITNTTANWNATCGKSGCYEFNLTSPLNSGQYFLSTALSYGGDTQIENKVINIIDGVMSAQSADKDGNIKELFGTNEYAYLSLSAYNLTSSLFNLSDAEIFIVSYMNGSEYSYSQVNYNIVNSSNSAYEWAWNSSLQRIKMDVPKSGGVYNVYIFGNNRSLGAETKFIVNPYDVCSVPKDTAGTVSSGYYYVWQFKTSDTVYFEIKATQANNPLGRATASNFSNGTGGMGSACNVDTTTKQVVSNATITLVDVKNVESGALQSINATESKCQASDSSGGYTCIVKPLIKWDGGNNIVKFSILGQDGTESVFYSRFEARAFYLYGWSSQWQNNPSNNISLTVQMYEAGSAWWGSGSSKGLSGSVSVKKVEYQGRDGEWIWPPVDSGYNVSSLNSSSITGNNGYITLPVSNMPGGIWKTGNYRIVLQGTTSSGDTDYGYAWFGVKLWDVYGQPIECLSTGCSYKNYFNSKENISLYVTINRAGASWWSSSSGGQNIYGNVTIGIKKIQDCRKWPCKELNSSQYSAGSIKVNSSSAGYWYSGVNLSSANNYIIQINSTSGSWGTGYYSVTLDVNGTDTGSAWFNTIAFYVETQPMNSSGSYKYSIRGNQPMWFNVTTTKSYKNGYWYTSNSTSIYSRYNKSDYINVTVDSAVLRTWDQQTYQSREFNYPTSINITSSSINGSSLINMTYLNGTWPTGYYWGELTLKNSDNETSTGWLWFNVQPFRVQINTVGNTYNMDSDTCINTTIYIYDPDWYSNNLLYGNYSITSVYENIWSGYSSSRLIYTNFTSVSFNASANITFCPNNGSWTGGSWGGYHYLNVIVKDNAVNDTQSGWLSFRTIPFQVSWNNGNSYIGNLATNANLNVSATLTKTSTGANTTGNLTKLYQWRYDNYRSIKEEYRFVVGNCDSSVSGQCTVNGTQNITVYAPSGGWKVGYNYIYAEWTKSNDATATVQDYSGIYFDGREAYNGWFDNSDLNGYYKYYFTQTENITIKLNVRDSSYNNANVNITNVQYSYPGDSCPSEWCRTYTTATYSPTTTTNGVAILNIKVPSGGWSKGYYYIKASISGSAGIGTVTGGNVRVKDMIPPNITISVPVNNATYSNSISFSATTTKSSQCSINIINYNNFYNWHCGSWNSTNSSANASVTSQTLGACNITKYNYNGSNYYLEYFSKDYHSLYDGTNYSYCSSYSGNSCYGQNSYRANTYLTTGGTSHTYTLNIANYTTQHYGMTIWCYDEDYNSANALAAFKINNTVS